MEPNHNQPEISRRDFLKITKETVTKAVAAVALASSIRSAFAPSPNHRPPDLSPTIKPPENTAVLESEIRDRLIESMLQKITVVDSGQPGTGEPLTPLDTWRMLTRNFTLTEEEFEERWNLENSLELTYAERLARPFMYTGGHGKTVMDSLRTGLETVADYHGEGKIDFLPYVETEEELVNRFSISVLDEKWYSKSGETRGPQILSDSQPPTAKVKPGKIGSGSFQFGKSIAAFAEEQKLIQNLVLTSEEVKRFLIKQANYVSSFNKYQAPKGKFIFPLGTGLEDISSVIITKRLNDEIVDQSTLDINYSQEKQDHQSNAQILDDTAPIEHYQINLKSGQVVEINPDPQEDDYALEWVRLESLTDRPPEKILGAYNPDNPFKTENILRLRDFLLSQPDVFWVLATGNYGDVINDEDLAILPENCIFVGQVTIAYHENKPFYVGTLGDTRATTNSIYVVNRELGISGDGSSLATPQIAAAAGLYSIESKGQALTRSGFLNFLKENHLVFEHEFMRTLIDSEGVPQNGNWKTNILNVPEYAQFIEDKAHQIVTQAKTTSRRDFLRGKLNR